MTTDFNGLGFQNPETEHSELKYDLVITAGDDGIIYVYSIDEGSLVKTLVNNKSSSGGINKFIVNDNSQLIAAHNDRSLRVWSLKTFELQFVLRDHDEDIEVS